MAARNGSASAALSNAPETPNRIQILWSTKKAAISSAGDAGDSGGKSCATPEKLAP